MILNETRVLIRTENLGKSCRLGSDVRDVVTDLNIKIIQGEFVIIEGLKGNQKKAFFNLMGCLEKPDAGKYFFDYEDIALARTDTLGSIRKNKIGYLFRDFNLINRLTAAENIEIPIHGLDITKEEKKERLQKSLKCLNIEAVAGQKAGDLTDFEKQMVSLARAVVNNPIMIIAEEPAANLDSREEKLLMDKLLKLNDEGMTIVLFVEKAVVSAGSGIRAISFDSGRVLEDKQAHALSLVRREA